MRDLRARKKKTFEDCRFSVYREGSKTKIGMIRPTALLALFPGTVDLKPVAEDVERETMRMIDEAKYGSTGSCR